LHDLTTLLPAPRCALERCALKTMGQFRLRDSFFVKRQLELSMSL